MRPFIHLSRYSKIWYIDTDRESGTPYPGTYWTGYGSLPEAMEAALAARIAEPA